MHKHLDCDDVSRLAVWLALIRAIDNACGQELGGFQTANLNHSEYIHIGQIHIWCHTRKQCLPMAIYTSIWQQQEMDSAPSSWKIICASSQLCIPLTFGQFSESSLPRAGVFNFLSNLATVTSPQQNPTKMEKICFCFENKLIIV